MSEPVLLPAIFKGATEVTTLASTDRILAVDSNGNPVKATANTLLGGYRSGNQDTAQWIRFAKFSNAGAALLVLQTSWSYNPGERLLIDLLVHPHNTGYCKCTVLSKMVNSGASNVISKLRFVLKRNAECYIDFYYASNQRNDFSCRLIAPNELTLIPFEKDAQIPDGYTAREVDLTQIAFGGGGKTLFTNVLRNYRDRRCA